MSIKPSAFLRELLDVAISSADPDECVAPNLPEAPKGRTIVVGAVYSYATNATLGTLAYD